MLLLSFHVSTDKPQDDNIIIIIQSVKRRRMLTVWKYTTANPQAAENTQHLAMFSSSTLTTVWSLVVILF